jgi:hypothetical protein
MQFASVPDLVQGWTFDRRAISRAVGQVTAAGGTAMYDAIAQALPIAADGRNQKKGDPAHLRRQRYKQPDCPLAGCGT